MTLLDRVRAGAAWRLRRLHEQALYRFARIYRRTLRKTLFVGITGSTGKTTTKDLVASVLEQGFGKGRKSPGSANWPVELAHVVLGTRWWDRYCVTEVSTIAPGFMDLPLSLVRPAVGVVTNIGTDHFAAFRSRDAIAAEKSRLVKSLPADGIAILNADDPLVLAMRRYCAGRVITHGTGDEAMLRGEAIQSAWPDRLSLTVRWDGRLIHVKTRLCGTHWAPSVLAALATGVALGIPLEAAAEAVARVMPFEGRMSPVELDDGVTFIRDDWKAPIGSVAPAFQFMALARAKRKIIVVGTVSDYPGDSARRYVQIGRQALAVADCVVFVGPWASSSLRAKDDAGAELRAFTHLREAARFLQDYLQPGDLVLLKGSHRADHLQRLVLARTTGVECWRSDCGRAEFCNACESLHRPSGPDLPGILVNPELADNRATGESTVSPVSVSGVFVVGLGNPGEQYAAAPHNVGQRVLDILSERLAQPWTPHGDLAMLMRARADGMPICLVKPIVLMNHVGPALLQLARELGFGAEQCILLHDDLDLPIGSVRTRVRGGDGGHRGVRSILQSFQDDRFRRVKIGIGRPAVGVGTLEYLLAPFPAGRLPAVDEGCRTAADRVLELIRHEPVRHALSP